MEEAAVHRLAALITQLTLCQVSTEEIDTATKLVEKACQKLRGIPDVPPQRITDLENATRQLRQLSCILDSCTISASYEVSQAQKALLLMPRTTKGASTSSEEFYAQVSLPTDEEEPNHQDQLPEKLENYPMMMMLGKRTPERNLRTVRAVLDTCPSPSHHSSVSHSLSLFFWYCFAYLVLSV